MKKSIIVAVGLLFIQMAWLAQDMGYINFFNFKKNKNDGAIGEIVEIKNQTKIKSAQSLYWSQLLGKEQVQIYDSLLTKEDSYITVKLYDETEFTVEPNSLIVLEKSDGFFDQFNLVIKRGGVKPATKNKQIKINIVYDKSVPQSPVPLEKTVDSSLPLDENSNNLEQVETKTPVVEPVKSPFVWSEPKNNASFQTDDKFADIPVAWSEEPHQIILENTETRNRALATKEQIKKLPEGSFKITVVSPNLTSETRMINVTRTPKKEFFAYRDAYQPSLREPESTEPVLDVLFENSNEDAVDTEVSTKVETTPIDYSTKNRSWFWFGSGYQTTEVTQSIPSSSSNLNFSAAGVANAEVAGGHYFNNSVGIELAYSQFQAKVKSSDSITVSNGDYSSKSLGVDGLYKLNNFVFKSGLIIEEKPTFFLNTTTSIVSLKDVRYTGVNLGLEYGYDWTDRATLEFLGSYVYSLSESAASGDSISMGSSSNFNTSVGLSYKLRPYLLMGFYWLGSWQSYSQTYTSESIENVSTQDNKNSNLQFRLGTEF